MFPAHASNAHRALLHWCAVRRNAVRTAAIATKSEDGGKGAVNLLSAKPFKTIPGPRGYPLVGNIEYIFDQPKKRFPALSKVYGPIFSIKVLHRTMVVVSDADLVEQVCRSEAGKIPCRSTMIEKNVEWIHKKNDLSDGLVYAYQDEWKRLRSAMSKQVTPHRLSHFTPSLCSIADELCDHMTAVQKEGSGQVDGVYPYLQKWALKGVSKIVFNENVDVFSGKNSQANDFVRAAIDFVESLFIIGRALPLYKFIPTKPYKEYVERVRRLYSLGEQLLRNHYNSIVSEIEKGTVDETVAVGLLDQWLIEGKLSKEEAITQACVMLGAGVDTTSNTATFMLHELAKNTQIQDALYKEVMEVVGPTAPPTAEQLQKLHLVRNCVRETLRLYPVTGAIARSFLEDIVVHGYRIPAGISFIFFLNVIGRDKKYFPNPEKFDPNRWSTANSHPFASLPFGYGTRMCYGRRIAELKLHVLLTRVVQRFRLSTDQTDLKVKYDSVLRPDEPVVIKTEDLQN